jgi:hypothetical protein
VIIKKNRDFIDFIIDLIKLRKVFYIIAFLFIVLSIYFNNHYNKDLKYSYNIKISNESEFVSIIETHNVIKRKPSEFLERILEDSVSYKDFKERACVVILGSPLNKGFILSLVDKYSKSPYYQDLTVKNKSKEDLYNLMLGSINIQSSNFCVKITISGREHIVAFMKDHYIDTLSQYLNNEFNLVYANTKILKLRSLRYLQSLGVNKNDVNTVKAIIGSVRTLEMDILDKNYFEYSISSVSPIMSKIFVYVFAIFLSIVFYIIVFLSIDFKRQFLLRSKESQ